MSKCATISAQVRKSQSRTGSIANLSSSLVVGCLSLALGFEESFFNDAVDVNAEDSQTQMRMLHYMPSEKVVGTWRAGAHTDIGCLTLLFQRDGEDGLEVLPGRETNHSKMGNGEFSPIPAKTGPIVVNIGDMLSKFSCCLQRF